MKKILSIIFCFIMCLVFVGCENNKLTQLKKELCYYNYQIENNYDTPETCFKALLSLKMVQEENETSINRKSFSLDYDEEEK